MWKKVREIKFGSIRTRLLIVFIALAAVPLIIVSIYTSLVWQNDLQERTIAQLESIATLKQEEIKTWTDRLHNNLALLLIDEVTVERITRVLQDSSSSDQNPEAYQKLKTYFQQSIIQSQQFEEIFLLDSQGRVAFSTNPLQEGKIEARQTYFQQGISGQTYVQPPFYSPSLQKTSVVVVRPVTNQQEEVIGVLAGRANLERLNEIMQERTGLGETGETYLVGSNNVLLTASRFPQYNTGTTYIRTEGANSVLTNRQNGSGIYNNYRDEPTIGVYHWVPALEVGLISELNLAEAQRATNTTLAITGGVVFIFVLVAVGVSLLVTRSIANPLSDLAQTATQIAAGNLSLTARVLRDDEIGTLAEAFNAMTAQLRNFIDTLEQRVRERTRDLEISAEISHQLSNILDVDDLLQYVVNRLQKEFDFYHTHIYLVEEETGDLVMAEGSGQVGQQLKEKGHRLQAGQGIVGTVASTNEHFFSNNVDEVSNFVRNPLLPNTQSELAVPLRKGDQVLGVLDIQSEEPNRFTDEDLELMQSIANQTAVALDNARLLVKTQTALDQVERLNRRLTHETWEQTTQKMPIQGYRFSQGNYMPITSTADFLRPPMKQAAAKKQPIRLVKPGNGEGPTSELAVPLMLRGEVIGVLGVKRDKTPDWATEEVSAVEAIADQITRALENARLSEEQEKTIEQLKEVDRLKSEFLTSMSHELRTPLNSIIGFADVLLQGIDGELNELALNDVQLIYSSGQHLLALINDILDLSKIEAGQMELVLEPVDVRATIKDALSASKTLLKDKPVEVIIDTEKAIPPAYADKLRLNQVLLNLVSNAAKFTDEGSITIKAEVDDEQPDKMRIAVIDTGIGISEDKLETIFDRFHQADSSTTRKYGGTGLGLAICKQLVELHGGELHVRSQEGEGSEFYFTIPLATEEPVEE